MVRRKISLKNARKSKKANKSKISRRLKKSKRSKRSRKQVGSGYTLGQAVSLETPYAQEIVPLSSDCLDATRPGLVSVSGTGGLPGFQGGRYEVDVGKETIAGMPEISPLGCEKQLGGADASYIVPTAGYTNQASTWSSSVGSPSLLQIPYDAKTMNPACLTTNGGGKKRTKRDRKSYRK